MPMVAVSLAAVLFVVSLTPGPAAAYCLAIGMEEDDRDAIWAPIGVTLGKVVHLAIAAAGATWINDLPSQVRVGALVVAVGYLALTGVRHWSRQVGPAPHNAERSGPHEIHIVIDGFLVSVANPESLASAVAILPLFVTDAMSGSAIAGLVMGGAMAVFAAYLLYEVIARTLAHHFRATTLNRVVGATYMIAATGLAVLAAL
jgi:threonine/homoserine/homoserine lactone efflux protein